MLLERFWAGVTALVGWLTLSPFSSEDAQQALLGVETDLTADISMLDKTSPIFYPPGGKPNSTFQCDYSRMGKEWRFCSIPENRECWLRHRGDGREFNIHTDYEKYAPVGIDRYYTLVVNDSWLAADGLKFTAAKLFNDTYPGPWIEACWGDTIHVTVINSMAYNGTSIHWHGIRQNQTTNMDGVNGVTQCPIAPKDNMTYVFKTTQYGSSWYHSHYSVQYSDGLQGPLTIHGPTSAPYDEPKTPLLMTDWNHISGFEILNRSPRKKNTTILLNGRGNVSNFGFAPVTEIEPQYHITFEPRNHSTTVRARRYLLRLINTSFDTTFVFSIDNHWLQVVGADFVPIEPYWNTSVLIGIGQRYHVIVEADPDETFNNGTYNNALPEPHDGNFWIRTWVADNCGHPPKGIDGYEKTGIVRYNRQSTAMPHSKAWPDYLVSKRCSDETYSSLVPKIPWYIGPAANRQNGHNGEQYNVTFKPNEIKAPWPHALFSFEPKNASVTSWTPLRINYSDPSFFHLDNSSFKWREEWVVLPENYDERNWVYLVLSGNKQTTTAAHPIHLHGHDFAILQQEENKPFTETNYKPNLENPPRRDVVLLPKDGFVVIAFRTDNPGNWLMHCHIADHASFGLAAQILERQQDAHALFPNDGKDMIEAKRVCKNWVNWVSNCTNWWPQDIDQPGVFPACKDKTEKNPFYTFRDDSGI